MTPERFHDLCRRSSHRAVRQPGRIDNLKLSVNKRGESHIREPEMVYAFSRELDVDGGTYGIEVPTGGRYRFVDEVGDRRMRARHDLVIFGEREPEVLVEFKREQPAADGDDNPAISKDLRKLLREEAAGKSMFHICHGSNRRTQPAVLKKYRAAFAYALANVNAGEVERANARGWYALYILVLHDRNDHHQAVLRRFFAPSLAVLRAAMPRLTINQFSREVIPRDA